MNYIITSILCLCIMMKSLALTTSVSPDTIQTISDSGSIKYFHNDFETQGTGFFSTQDTVIPYIQRYETSFGRQRYFANLGNPGLAHSNMFYNPELISGYRFGIISLDPIRFFSDSVKYYSMIDPYTHVGYVMGPKREQNLRVLHAQDVSGWLSAGLDFRYGNAPGLYRNQKGDYKNFVVNARLQTRNYRYMVLTNFMHNKLKIQENGGIIYDSVFEQNVITSRDGILVNLNTAKNDVKQNSFYVKQLFNISNKGRFFAKGRLSDSVSPAINRKGIISHSFNYSKTTYLYQQNLSDNNGFYQFTFDSAHPTYDSSHIFKIENQLSWTNSNAEIEIPLLMNLKLRYLYTEESVDSSKTIFNQVIPTAEIVLNILDPLTVSFFGDYLFGSQYSNDYNLAGRAGINTKFGKLSYELKVSRLEAPRLFHFYKSNHFRWENDLKKQYILINKVGYRYKSLNLGLTFNSVDNFVYFDENALPGQVDKNMKIFQAQVAKMFVLGDFTFDGLVIYQNASSKEEIRLPEWIGDLSIYYTKPLFKNATTIRTGFDLFYYTSYYSYGYMPATRAFYIQNEKKTGNYLYADVFFNVKIKRAHLFLKYCNLGYLFNDFRYYTVPGYPMKDGAFRFGVMWGFFD